MTLNLDEIMKDYLKSEPSKDVLDLVKKQSRDSKEWASCFCEYIDCLYDLKIDESYVHSWFANAMMAVHDSIHNNEIKLLQKQNKIMREALEVFNLDEIIKYHEPFVEKPCVHTGSPEPEFYILEQLKNLRQALKECEGLG